MKIVFLTLFISAFYSGYAQKFSSSFLDTSFNDIIGMDIDSASRRFQIMKIETPNSLKFCLSYFKVSGKIVGNRIRFFDSVYVTDIYCSINKDNHISLVIFMINHGDHKKISDSLKLYFGKPGKIFRAGFNKIFGGEAEDLASYFWRFHRYGVQLLSNVCSGYYLLLLTNNHPEQYMF